MISLNVPYTSLHSSALVLVFKSRKVAVRQVKAEGMSLVPLATLASESVVAQPTEVKAKRRRKTKSEYAALALLPVEQKEKDKHKGGGRNWRIRRNSSASARWFRLRAMTDCMRRLID